MEKCHEHDVMHTPMQCIKTPKSLIENFWRGKYSGLEINAKPSATGISTTLYVIKVLSRLLKQRKGLRKQLEFSDILNLVMAIYLSWEAVIKPNATA